MTDFDSCYAMREGKLVLRGIVNQVQPNDTAPYLTGGVYTKGKKAFINGRIEICAKLNAAIQLLIRLFILIIPTHWASQKIQSLIPRDLFILIGTMFTQ